MARKGRKRKQVKREPNGRASREGQADKVFDVARNQPHRRNLANFRDDRAAHELGRLSIAGQIDGEEYEAGKVWQRVVAAHRRAMHAPSPDPRACGADYIAERIGGDGDADPVDIRTDDERAQSATARYMRAFRALHETGRPSLMEVNAVCIRDEPARDIDSLRRGLAALAWCFGIATARRKTMMQCWRAA